MKANLKSLAVWGGRSFLLVAIVFVGLKLRSHWSDISAWRPDGSDIILLIGLSVFYGSALFLLAEGWHWVVNLFGNEKRSRTYPSFTMTQIAKYIPGNFSHLLGRGLYLRGNTLSDPQIVKATLIELVAIPAGAIVCIVFLGSTGQLNALISQFPILLWWVCGLTLAGAPLVAFFVANRLGGDFARYFPGLIVSVGLAVIFMGSLGVTFAAVFLILAPAPIVPLAGAAILAWLIGFLTPGAPGGIGIREAAFVTLLAGFNQEETVLIAAALFRLVTTFGDVFLLAIGWLVLKKIPALSAR